MPFSWEYFLPKNSGAECQFLRNVLMHGDILLGNRPNFFVEHMTKSQNQPYRFKSGKDTFPWAKLLITPKKGEFKCQILEKWQHRGSLLAKNTKAGRLFCSNFLKQSVTKIKNAAKNFQRTWGRRPT